MQAVYRDCFSRVFPLLSAQNSCEVKKYEQRHPSGLPRCFCSGSSSGLFCTRRPHPAVAAPSSGGDPVGRGSTPRLGSVTLHPKLAEGCMRPRPPCSGCDKPSPGRSQGAILAESRRKAGAIHSAPRAGPDTGPALVLQKGPLHFPKQRKLRPSRHGTGSGGAGK